MKCHQNLLMLIVVGSLSLNLSAQRFYITTGEQVGKVNLSPSGCSFTNISTCNNGSYFSITLFKKQLYYVHNEGVYESTLVNGKAVNCKLLADLPSRVQHRLRLIVTGSCFLHQKIRCFLMIRLQRSIGILALCPTTPQATWYFLKVRYTWLQGWESFGLTPVI